MIIKSIRICAVWVIVAFTCVACASLSPEFLRHYEVGAAAVDAGDFKTGIPELEAALAINPDGSSLAWHKLAYAYVQVGREDDGWAAMRKAIIINPISSERKKSFYAMWSHMRQRINLGDSETQVRRHLGVPDVEMIGPDWGLWGYGVVSLKFQGGKLSEIIE